MIPRVIPCLLMDDQALVKTRAFASPRYVGDPVNVLSIFSDFEVDEILLLDIRASLERRPPPFQLLERLASEATMPLGYGGGLSTAEQVTRVLEIGFEKVVINTAFAFQQRIIEQSAERHGSQALVVSLDCREVDRGAHRAFFRSGTLDSGESPESIASRAESLGAGEILVTSIDAEGSMRGFDLDLVRKVANAVNVPVVAHGGAGCREDLVTVIDAGATAVAAGSLFVFQAKGRGVLINYPSMKQRCRLFEGMSGDGHPTEARELARIRHRAGAPGPIRIELPPLPATRTCTRCLYDDTTPGISFDETGMCSYCRLHDEMELQYPTGLAGSRVLDGLLAEMKDSSRGKAFDCVIGVSGGCDSSYLVHEMVARGVRPLAVHFDNTWNSPIATNNIFAVLEKLNVELETLVVDNQEYDDLYRSFMLAGVKDIDIVTDIGFMSTLYQAAERHGIKYIVEGHSFRTEGVAPLGWVYMDGAYIESVHRRFGSRPLRTFPNMSFGKFVRWSALSGIRRMRPLYYMDYHKEEAKQFLSREYGWEWYGGHHLENRWTAFAHLYFLPSRFGIDTRLLGTSALIRSDQLTRSEGVALIEEPIECPRELLAMVRKRLGFDETEFDRVMTGPTRDYTDFRTYKKRFARLKPIFWALYKLDRVPKSFYVKFCGGRP